MFGVIGVAVAGLRMNQNIEAAAVKHQPWHEAAEFLGSERNLIHRDRVRPYRYIAPPAEFACEATRDLLAQALRDGPASRVVIDMNVITADRRQISQFAC